MNREPLRRLGETIRNNKAETMWLAIGAAALAYEVAAPDKTKDLLSDAAFRHQGIAIPLTLILGTHFTKTWEHLGAPELDVVSQIGKQLGRFAARKTGELVANSQPADHSIVLNTE